MKGLIVFANRSIIEVWQGPEYAYAVPNYANLNRKLELGVFRTFSNI